MMRNKVFQGGDYDAKRMTKIKPIRYDFFFKDYQARTIGNYNNWKGAVSINPETLLK